MICAPDSHTAIRWIGLFCLAALFVAICAIIGSIARDPGPPPQIRNNRK